MINAKNWRIVAVDDHPLFADSFSRMLKNTFPEISFSGSFYNAVDAIKYLKKNEVDIVFMDIEMKGMNGFDATGKIKNLDPNIKVIGLTFYNEAHIAQKMFKAGANGFITKSTPTEELKKAIQTVMKGEKYIAQDIAGDYVQHTLTTNNHLNDLFSLRQRTIIRYIKQGMIDKEISQSLNISIKTTEKERAKIYQILKVKNAAEMVGKAFELKLLP